MSKELTNLPPEDFLRLAVSRGGLELDDVVADLSPQAAKALGLIIQASTSISPELESKDPVSRGTPAVAPVYRSAALQAYPCPKCGHSSRPGNRFCTHCGHDLGKTAAPTTLDHLVEQGHLTDEEASEALEAIPLHQSHYPAGTRYGVFGSGLEDND